MYQSKYYYLRSLSCKVFLCVGLGLASLLSSSCTNTQQVAPKQTVEEEYIYHKIKYPGETVAIISAWYTKSSKNWPEIVDANPKMVPSRLRIGDLVRIPKRLVRKFVSLPREFVSSFGSGINKDSSKGDPSGNLDASDFKVENPEEAAPSKQVDREEIVTQQETQADERIPSENTIEELPAAPEVEERAEESTFAAPDVQPSVVAEEKKVEESPPQPDENQKIREQLMQELLQ